MNSSLAFLPWICKDIDRHADLIIEPSLDCIYTYITLQNIFLNINLNEVFVTPSNYVFRQELFPEMYERDCNLIKTARKGADRGE